MRFIGDVHGKIKEYINLTEGCEDSIQLGDLGAGFVDLPILSKNHRFIRGNHDDPAICRAHPNWIKDTTFDPNTSIFFLGGAYSIDKEFRNIGIDWWEDEQLPIKELFDAIDYYAEFKPRIVVTHECPQDTAEFIFPKNYYPEKRFSSRTGMALQRMFEIWQPEYWLFGHWHKDATATVFGTKFVCLGELSVLDIEV